MERECDKRAVCGTPGSASAARPPRNGGCVADDEKERQDFARLKPSEDRWVMAELNRHVSQRSFIAYELLKKGFDP